MPPAELARLLETLPEDDNGFRNASLEGVIGEWASASPQEVMNWLDNYQGNNVQDLLYTTLLQWGIREPSEALARLDLLEDSETSISVVDQIADEMTDNKALVEWLRDEVPSDIAIAVLPRRVVKRILKRPRPNRFVAATRIARDSEGANRKGRSQIDPKPEEKVSKSLRRDSLQRGKRTQHARSKNATRKTAHARAMRNPPFCAISTGRASAIRHPVGCRRQ